MHYCILVITKEFPTNKVLEKKMTPYSEETFYEQFGENDEIPTTARPQFLWDYWKVGGRYCAKIKLKIDKANEEYNWDFIVREARAGRLFRSMLLEDCLKKKVIFFEEDYYPYIGYYDDYLRVDGAKIKDIIDFEDLAINHNWGFIGKDDEVYSRDYYNGEKWIDDDQYEEKVRKAIEDVSDCYACIIDIHD